VIWYLSDLVRFKSEREGLEELALSAEWLTPIGWRVDDRMRIVLDAEIAISGRVYPVSLRFPEHFPYTPPSVLPRGDDSRWSNHQFGAGGELCLEFGSDNWTPDITGAQMLQSACRLLEGENPAPGARGTVASRHNNSLGQILRSERTRLLLTRTLDAFLAEWPAGITSTGTVLAGYHKSGNVYILQRIALADDQTWNDASVPSLLSGDLMEWQINIFRLPSDTAWPPTDDLQTFEDACAKHGFNPDQTFVLLLKGAQTKAYFIHRTGKAVYEMAIVPAEAEARRLDNSHDVLRQKSVALIGCGSLGSKVATMLARCGVTNFYLVDDDVLMPDNFVRNDLDWRDVGSHKADGVARRLQFANPAADARVRRIQLAGMESSGTGDEAIKAIGLCDLIFDATANPNVLNLLAMVAEVARKPIIWAEVFAGGIGGLIVRCRPEQEPAPQLTRRVIENWFGDRNATPLRAVRDYGTGGEGIPLIADDADVSAIAAAAVRLAVDTLVARDPSLFPYSAYAIGLGVGSVFTQPFEIFPIEIPKAPAAGPKRSLSTEDSAAELARIISLFEPK
jgi:molybdopterin/thiamine biosynthesis adenylyltransferase/ubiquitin-protein ligase